ncbi:MAG: LLM class flavin-dependent oxidoreductase [Acidimicrobiia bacterium]|nr:LLM class flavin-dependent oxidoreductase [Acidimicrobiia bacterium]
MRRLPPPQRYGGQRNAERSHTVTKPSSTQRPAISLVASATRRNAVLQLAAQAESHGFTHVACPSLGAAMPLCTSLAHATTSLRFFTSIQPIYLAHPVEAGNTASHIHEVSGGRFAFGIGVSHGPVTQRLGVQTGKPLGDIRNYVAAMRTNEKFGGALPPIYLATLRDKMLDLAIKIADGALWANASLRGISRQVERVPHDKRTTFFMANMIPTVVSDDIEECRRQRVALRRDLESLRVETESSIGPVDPRRVLSLAGAITQSVMLEESLLKLRATLASFGWRH